MKVPLHNIPPEFPSGSAHGGRDNDFGNEWHSIAEVGIANIKGANRGNLRVVEKLQETLQTPAEYHYIVAGKRQGQAFRWRVTVAIKVWIGVHDVIDKVVIREPANALVAGEKINRHRRRVV
jgi:hypothetical protein